MSTKTQEVSPLLRDLEARIAELRCRLLEPLETGKFRIREQGEDVTEIVAASLRKTVAAIEAVMVEYPRQEPTPDAGAVLHARPVEGEIDHAALSREHIARYPKIRAALAE